MSDLSVCLSVSLRMNGGNFKEEHKCTDHLMPACVSVYLSPCVSVYLSVCLSVCLILSLASCLSLLVHALPCPQRSRTAAICVFVPA